MSPLGTTLFNRMIEIYGSGNMTMLTVQYRMNAEINDFPSKIFYGRKLIAAPFLSKRRLIASTNIKETENTAQAVVFVDT